MSDDLWVQLVGGGGAVVLVGNIISAITSRRKLRTESEKDEAEATQVITTAGSEVINNLREDIRNQREELGRQRTESREEIERLRDEVRRLRIQLEQRDERHRDELAAERRARRAAEDRADRHATSLAELARLITTEAYRTAAADLLRTGDAGPLPPMPEPDPEGDAPVLPPHQD